MGNFIPALYEDISLLFEDHSRSSGSYSFHRKHVLGVRWDGQLCFCQCRSVNHHVVSIKESSASPLHSVIPLLLVPSANWTQQVCGWKSSLNFLNLAVTMMICKVSHEFTISPFSMILHSGTVLLTFLHSPCFSPQQSVSHGLTAVFAYKLHPDVWCLYSSNTTACVDKPWLYLFGNSISTLYWRW